MMIIIFKLLCLTYTINKNSAIAIHGDSYNSKDEYIRLKQRQIFFRDPSSKVSVSFRHPHYPTYPLNRHELTTGRDSDVRIRHSHHPHLDGVISKVMKFQISTTKPRGTSWNSKTDAKASPENDNNFEYMDSEDVGDEDLDEDAPDYDEWENEGDENENSDKNDDFEEYDEDFTENYEDKDDRDENSPWQAEEASDVQGSYSSPSSVTQYKWDTLGSRTRVEETRRKHYPSYSSGLREVNEAVQHALKIHHEARCRIPYPKIISIQSIYPDTKKTYIPHCTILHRCTEDTGCCSNHRTRCAVKSQEKIELYFYTTSIGGEGNKVERLSFFNHTECACIDKSIDPTSSATTVLTLIQNPQPFNTSNISVRSAQPTLTETIRKCKCPEEYKPGYHYYPYRCYCDCYEENLDCLRMKRGKEFFSLKDRVCIKNNQCGHPSCEYGTYQHNLGRCPRKHERTTAHSSN